jgi:non-ribosomal peptide synthase protein (TIGR01720 family)
VPKGARIGELRAALQAVLDRHGSLRSQLTVSPDGRWRLVAAGQNPAGDVLSRVDVRGLAGEQLAAVVTAEGEAARLRLRPTKGVMCQAVWFDFGQHRAGRLLLVLHHLVVDAVSWRILLPDLASAWRSVVAGHVPVVEPVFTSMPTWALALAEEARRPSRVRELALWQRVLTPADPILGSRPLNSKVDVVRTVRSLSVSLPAEHTGALLTTVPAAFHAGINDVLLTGLALAVGHCRGARLGSSSEVVLDLEGHGREDIVPGLDLTRTVGWFTSLYPVRLDPGQVDWQEVRAGGPAVGQALKAVKEQLRVQPDNGIGYGLLRYLNGETAPVLAALPSPQLAFNYLGRFGSVSGDHAEPADWEQVSDIPVPAHRDEDQPVAHVLEINAAARRDVDGLRLMATWMWPEALLAENEVRELAEAWLTALRGLVLHVESLAAGGHTPSDLSLALDQGEIDELETELGTWR